MFLPPRAGFVLVGGASSRMGANKAFLTLHDRPMALHVAEMVADVAGNVTLIGPPAVYGHLGLLVVPDQRSGCGPLAGIETALGLTTADFNLIVACDLPGLSAQLLKVIFEAAEAHPDADVTMPAGPEPLCAVYRSRALTAIRDALDQGTRKITDAFAKLRLQVLPIADIRPFANINTPDDWRRYTQG